MVLAAVRRTPLPKTHPEMAKRKEDAPDCMRAALSPADDDEP